MKLLSLLLICGSLWAGQSVIITQASSGSFTDPNLGAGRMDFEVHDITYPTSGYMRLIDFEGSGYRLYLGAGTITIEDARDAVTPNQGCLITVPTGSSPYLIRARRDVAGSQFTCERWKYDATSYALSTPELAITSTTSGSGGTIGLSMGPAGGPDGSISFGFIHIFNSPGLVGARPPTTADLGNVIAFRFDGNGTDSSGNGRNATLASVSYLNPTPNQVPVALPKTYGHPVYANWHSLRAGYDNQLDGTDSYSLIDSSSTVTYAWTHVSGASTPTYVSSVVGQPTIRDLVFGPYIEHLVVTDADLATATANIEFGATYQDENGVVVPADSRVRDFFGLQIAFGKNPFGHADKQNLYAITSQIAYQATVNDYLRWTTPGQGTVSYPFVGKGPWSSPGISCTTLSGGINATTLSIAVTNASCLSLTSLPTWILIGNASNTTEMVRICSTTATTGAATLTACFDGRGMSGNLIQTGGSTNVTAAASHSMGDTVGEFRIQGTSTLFETDSNRPIAPAGLGAGPAPPGTVVYSTGKITLTPGSTTVVLSMGGSWAVDGIGTDSYGYGWIYSAGTTHGGITFPFWRQIVSRTDSTHLEMDHGAPTGVDGTAFDYKITSHNTYVSLEFAAKTDHHTSRALHNVMGCESETACFAVVSHDVPELNVLTMGSGGDGGTGLKYSTVREAAGVITGNGTTDPDFYGSASLNGWNFYFASGYAPALALAESASPYIVRDPRVGDGLFVGGPLSWGGPALGAVAHILFSASPVLTWDHINQFAIQGQIGALGCNDRDTRDSGYSTALLTHAAKYDTNAPRKAAFVTALGLVKDRDKICQRTVAQGYSGAEVNSFSNSFVWNPRAEELVLTNGSRNVTGVGFTVGSASVLGTCQGVDDITLTVVNGQSTATVASGTLTQQSLIYFHDGTNTGVFQYLGSGGATTVIQLSGVWAGSSGTYPAISTLGGEIVSGGQQIGGYGSIWTGNSDTLANNRALEKVWACKTTSSTTATLYRTWDGPTSDGSHVYKISYYNIGAHGQQPFMLGIKTNQIRWGAQSDDATIAAAYTIMAPQVGTWAKEYGFDSTNTLGWFYQVIFGACGANTDVPAGSFNSIHGYQGCGSGGTSSFAKSVARVNTAEGGVGIIPYFQAQCLLGVAQCNAARIVGDTAYGATFGYSPLCTGSVVAYCSLVIAGNYDNASLDAYKWPGFFFGVGGFFSRSWPAFRTLGVTVPSSGAIKPSTLRIGSGVRQ